MKIATHPDATLPGFEEATVLTEKLDITVFHERYFRELIHDNIVKLLYLSAIPSEMVLLQTEPLQVKVSFQRLKSGIYNFIRVHERNAAACWRKNQIWAAKKKFLHVLRALDVALQLVNTQKIENLTSSNYLWPLCASIDFATYEELVSWYKGFFDPLYEELKLKANIYKTKFASLKSVGNTLHFLDYLQVQCANDTDLFERETCITATDANASVDATLTHDLGDQCFLFERTSETPHIMELRLAYRTLARFNGTTWDVLALGPRKIWEVGADRYVNESYEKFVDTIDWSTVMLFKKPVGMSILLFFDKNEWKIVCAHSGFLFSQYAPRFGYSKGHCDEIHARFWKLWDSREMRRPDQKFENFTFQFTFHFDEQILQLDAIMNTKSCTDVTVAKTCDVIADESLETPFLFFTAKLFHWDSIERIAFSAPHSNANNDELYTQNVESVLNIAKRAKEMDFFKHEGYLLLDASYARVQVSLSGFMSLMMIRSRYERKNRVIHMLRIVRATIALERGEERFCEYFPDWAPWYRYVAATFRRICADIDAAYEPLNKKAGNNFNAFRTAVEESGYEQQKIFFKLKAFKGSGALNYFTDADNIYHGPAPLLLKAWVDLWKPFDDVQHALSVETE